MTGKLAALPSRFLPLLLYASLISLAGCGSAPTAADPAAPDAGSGPSLAGAEPVAILGELAPLAAGQRALVVYFSQGSSTRRVATDLAALLGADTEEILELKPHKGYFRGGFDSSFGRATPIQAPLRDPAAYDTLVVCTPVWAWRLAPPVRSWFRLTAGKLPSRLAFVTVSGDTEPDKIVAMMEKESGLEPLAFVGFSDKHFAPENRAEYLGRIGKIVDAFR